MSSAPSKRARVQDADAHAHVQVADEDDDKDTPASELSPDALERIQRKNARADFFESILEQYSMRYAMGEIFHDSAFHFHLCDKESVTNTLANLVKCLELAMQRTKKGGDIDDDIDDDKEIINQTHAAVQSLVDIVRAMDTIRGSGVREVPKGVTSFVDLLHELQGLGIKNRYKTEEEEKQDVENFEDAGAEMHTTVIATAAAHAAWHVRNLMRFIPPTENAS